MKRNTISIICALAIAPAMGLAQGTQNEGSVHVMLPESGAGAATLTSGDLQFTDGQSGALSFGVFAPLRTTETGLLFYDVGAAASFDEDFNVTGASAKAGIVYRFHHTDETIFGVNAYIEGVDVDGSSDTLGLFSVGAEYEMRPQQENYFIQSGANYYVPLDDYTDDTEYGLLSAAPRMGGDAYVAVGRDYDSYSLLGSLDLFSYNETDTAQDLAGGTLSGEIAYRGDLPDGMVARFSLGVTGDNRAGTDPALIVGLGVDYTFGYSGGAAPRRDCRVVPDATGPERIDCSDPVTVADAASVPTKIGATLMEPTVIAPQRTTRVTPPRRHLGYGTAMTPIERVADNGPPAPAVSQGTLVINYVHRQPGDTFPFTVTTTLSNAGTPAPTFSFTEAGVPGLGPFAYAPGSVTRTENFTVPAGTIGVQTTLTDPPNGSRFASFTCDGTVSNLSLTTPDFTADVEVPADTTITCTAFVAHPIP